MFQKVIFHVPHDGTQFSKELLRSVCIAPDRFFTYHEKMRDTAARLFAPPEFGEVIAFDISRLLCDVERFTDGTEPMERFGMGFCYERVFDGTKIKQVDEDLRQRTMRYYAAHHKRLDDAVADFSGVVHFWDLHSFSREILTFTPTEPLPDICIGYDDFCPRQTAERVVKTFGQLGFTVAENYPYKGSLVPNAVLSGRAKCDITSLMVEVNKSAYLQNGAPDYSVIQKIRAAIFRAEEIL